jgi:hypothetical protein
VVIACHKESRPRDETHSHAAARRGVERQPAALRSGDGSDGRRESEGGYRPIARFPRTALATHAASWRAHHEAARREPLDSPWTIRRSRQSTYRAALQEALRPPGLASGRAGFAPYDALI